MFYTKATIGEFCEIKTEITDENVFTCCPECGAEHRVDLQEVLSESDLYETAVYCAECSRTMAERGKVGTE